MLQEYNSPAVQIAAELMQLRGKRVNSGMLKPT